VSEADGQPDIDNISILVFSVGGVRFGVEASQITAIDQERISVEDELIRLGTLLGLSESTDNNAGVLLELRHESITKRLLLVDKIEDIIEIPLTDIQLLPAVIAERLLGRGIWGVIQKGDKILILLDIHRVLKILKNMDLSNVESTASTNIQASQEDII